MSGERARIAEDERLAGLPQHEVIVSARREVTRLVPQLAGHPEMHAEPCVAVEPKQHLFAAGFRTNQPRAR